ncbi:MAG: hypothetical protein PVG32_16110, partial [Anaerolineales bacterium]
MLQDILNHFPPDTHPITLVSDPDGLLTDDTLLAALAERGFTILNESDPIRLRYHFTRSNLPLILVTDGPFNRLPYDIWQQGH